MTQIGLSKVKNILETKCQNVFWVCIKSNSVIQYFYYWVSVSLQTTDSTFVIYFRHLLSDQTDPFNRSPLTMDMVQPNVDLKRKIEEWIVEKRAKTKDAWSDSHHILNFLHRFRRHIFLIFFNFCEKLDFISSKTIITTRGGDGWLLGYSNNGYE